MSESVSQSVSLSVSQSVSLFTASLFYYQPQTQVKIVRAELNRVGMRRKEEEEEREAICIFGKKVELLDSSHCYHSNRSFCQHVSSPTYEVDLPKFEVSSQTLICQFANELTSYVGQLVLGELTRWRNDRHLLPLNH